MGRPTARAVAAKTATTATAAMLALAWVLGGCGLPDGDYMGKIPAAKDLTPGHLRWCNSGEPESLDPAMTSTTTAMKLLYAMFDGLAAYDAQGLPKLSMAERLDASPDQRRFTFHLRHGLTWTNGEPLDAYDVAYHLVRVLHPLTASPNVKALTYLKNGDAFNANAVRVVMRDTGGLVAGELVTIQAVGGENWSEASNRPDPNTRQASRALALRDLGAPETSAYAAVPPRTNVTIIEISGRPATLPTPAGNAPWAYVHFARGADAAYGWVPLAELDLEPNAARRYQVKRVAPEDRVGELGNTAGRDTATEATDTTLYEASGADLLMLPEALGVRVPDPHTVVLETSDPTPFLLNLVAQRAFRPTPRKQVSREPTRWFNPRYVGDVVSSGAMRITEWRERDYVELVRWSGYWDNATTRLDQLTAYSIDDQVASVNFYISGGCDAVTSNNVPASYVPLLNGERRGGRAYKDYEVDPYLGIYFILVNNQVLSNRHLRRALAMAIDRAQLPRLTKGGEIPSAQLTPGTPISRLSPSEQALCGVTPQTPGVAAIIEADAYCYVPPPGLDFDPAQAKRELELARQELGASFPTRISYKYNSGVEQHKLIAEFLQEQWRTHLGLATDLDSQEWKVYVAATRKGEYELGRFGNIMNFADPEPELLTTFLCQSPDNRLKYCNPAYEATLERAKREPDRGKRLLLAREAEAMLVGDGAIIPLYVYTQKNLRKPYVKDLSITMNDQAPIQAAWLDPNWDRAPAPSSAVPTPSTPSHEAAP